MGPRRRRSATTRRCPHPRWSRSANPWTSTITATRGSRCTPLTDAWPPTSQGPTAPAPRPGPEGLGDEGEENHGLGLSTERLDIRREHRLRVRGDLLCHRPHVRPRTGAAGLLHHTLSA